VTNEPEKRVFGVATSHEAAQTHREPYAGASDRQYLGHRLEHPDRMQGAGINGYGLLGETVNAPDPRASAATIEVLNKMYDLALRCPAPDRPGGRIETEHGQAGRRASSSRPNRRRRKICQCTGERR